MTKKNEKCPNYYENIPLDSGMYGNNKRSMQTQSNIVQIIEVNIPEILR